MSSKDDQNAKHNNEGRNMKKPDLWNGTIVIFLCKQYQVQNVVGFRDVASTVG